MATRAEVNVAVLVVGATENRLCQLLDHWQAGLLGDSRTKKENQFHAAAFDDLG